MVTRSLLLVSRYFIKFATFMPCKESQIIQEMILPRIGFLKPTSSPTQLLYSFPSFFILLTYDRFDFFNDTRYSTASTTLGSHCVS